MRIKLFNLIAFFFLICFTSFGQYNMATNNGQTITTCSGTFTDSGGSSSQYSNSENYTITFCSNNGLPLNFDFTTFDLDTAGDQLSFYNGTTATGTPIAVLDWLDDSSQVGTTSQLQIGTLSTCVTVKWTSNASNTDGGWVATVSCIAPPSCGGNPAAADIFGQATPICNLNSYCGNLSSYYGEDTPFNLRGGGDCPTPTDGIFGGSIENNSWLSFQASSNSATFDFNVPCGTDGIQVGIFGFDGSNFSLKSPCAITDGTNNGTFSVTGSNLTVCETYYIMIDGIAGATCNYSISANNGVVVANAGADQTICSTSTNLTANVATTCTTGTWTVITGTGNFANANSPTSSVSGLSNGTNVFRWTLSSGFCNSFDDVTITVNGGSATTIAYPSSSVANTVTTPQTITLTNGPVTGNYTATPTGLTINPTTGAVTPSTSAIGTYTVSAPTACGTATALLEISNSTCSTCSNATCSVTSITTTTAALGQTGIITAIISAGDNLGLTPLIPGQSATVCVPVTVVSNSVMLGFRQNFQAFPSACGSSLEQVITYQLRPASNCNASPIVPNRLNASSVGSGFNPEWDNLTAGNYVLCYTINVTNLSLCNPVDLQGLGYYNVIPPTGCTACATATCPATSITATTAALGQSGLNTALTSAGNQLNISLINGQSATVCVPVTVPSGSTILGFKHSIYLSLACAINSITYQLKPASNCSGPAILPNRVNAQPVSSGFNPEWDNLTPGNYILCYTISVTNAPGASCNGLPDIIGNIKSIDLQGLGYYNVIPPSCSTCATATCNVASITVATAPLGQTGIVTAIAAAGNNLGLSPLTAGQSVTVCVPVTVVANSTMLGFKQQFDVQMECLNPAIQVITYQLRPASNCNATPIVPNRTNASSTSSGFNPEWDNLPAGNYVLCYTLNIVSISTTCNPVNLHGLGYYNVVPVTVPCQDYQIQFYDDDAATVVHSGTTFTCSDAGVYLGPTTDPTPTQYNSGLPYPMLTITVTPISGNLNNLELIRYDASDNTIAEVLSVPASGISINYILRPAPGQYYKLDKTNAQSGTYSYTIIDVISGLTVASGTWTITAGAESAASITLIPQGSGAYSGPGVTNGFDQAGVKNYTNDRGIGFFNPSLAGAGTHTITYTWNNGLAAPNNCTLTRTKTVTVTGPIAPTTTNVSICSGTTATLTASAIATGATVKWYDASTGGNLLFTGNPFTTPTLTATTSYWVTQTTGGCESTRTQVNVSITPGTDATYTLTSTNCAPGSITFSSVLPTATTFDWVSGPSGYTFPVGFQTPSSTNISLTNLPAGTYCVDITSPNVAGGTITDNLFTEEFETGGANWTIDNSIGTNIFVINNSYTGGFCTYLNGFGMPVTATLASIINQNSAITGNVNSSYLHIKATNSLPTVCTASSPVFPPLNSNYNGSQTSNQKATLNTLISTIGYTNINLSFYWMGVGRSQDYGVVEYSTNGGGTWSQAGANLWNQATWTTTSISLPAAAANIANLKLRIRWVNDATLSSDPPLCIDHIVVTGLRTAIASCGSTKQECITINPIVTPTISCGTSTINSVQFTWPAVVGATSYTATHTINGGASVNDGTITSPFTISGLNPNDAVAITLTPVGGSGTCFGSASLTCTANACPTILTPSANQTLCLGDDPTSLSVNTTFTGSNTISFIYFNSQQTGSAMYTGGTLLGNATPSSGTASYNPGVLGTPGSLPNTAGTYFVYAIANPTPAGTTCRPFQEIRVVVNPNVTPTFTQVAAICSGATLSALPTSSTNSPAITGTWSPALNNTATTTYTFTPNAGQCATTATMTITVNPNVTPTFTQVAEICSGATLSALPTSSTNSPAITGTWSPALNNTATTTYTFTPNAGQCATTATMTITVNPNVTPTFTQVAAICSGAILSALPTSSTNSPAITGTWSPALNNTATTTYTFTPNAGQCATTATMIITVNPNITPTFTQVAAICSGATLSALPTFSTNSPAITGTWSPALNNTATTTYTFTPNAGQCATTATMTITVNPNVTPTFTQVAEICSGATLSALPTSSTNSPAITGTWSPALNNTATTTYAFTPNAGQCATTATMIITVNPNITPTFTQVAAICSGATLSALPTSSTNSPAITGTWSPALNNTATTTYIFTPTAGQCGLTTPATTMTIVVHPLPTVTPSVMTQSFCSGGTTNINLTSNVPGSAFYWTATGTSVTGQSGSVTGSGATSINQTLVLNANQVAAGQVTYVIVAEANGCLGAPVTVVVTVNPIPNVIVSPASLAQTICSGQATNISFSGAINNTVYTWSVVSSVGVSGALNGSGTSINQTLTTTGTSQGTVVYEVTPSLNGCTGTPKRITVTVNPVPEIFGSATHPDLCSGERPTSISVSTFNAATVYNWVVVPVGVSGASAGTDSGLAIVISQLLTTTGTTRGYVDYIITPVLTGCPGLPITVRVYVNPLPVVSLTDGTICVNAAGVPFQTYELDSGLNDVDYDFVWTFGGVTIPGATSATYTATQIGTYSVVATNSTTNCVSNVATAVVTPTIPATGLTITQSEFFSDYATITVNVIGGTGTLLYQLDDGVLQESNVFTDVSGGKHIITVVDTQGCTYLTKEVMVIDYPKYFTPNGDGINDTWNIIGLNQPDAKLFIFDRYGKLLKQLSTTGIGWDGTYIGAQLPSTDYWFTLDYSENGTQKQFKSHFSLKR